MSGGYFNYQNNSLAYEIFGFGIDIDYNMEKDLEETRKFIKKQNKFEDVEISEIIYDMFCLLHSYSYYKDGDIGKETYLKDVQYFKNKWLGTADEKRITKVANDLFTQMKEELTQTFNLNMEELK